MGQGQCQLSQFVAGYHRQWDERRAMLTAAATIPNADRGAISVSATVLALIICVVTQTAMGGLGFRTRMGQP